MAGGEPRLGTTATYMRHNDHGATRLSTKIDRLHDRHDNEYRVFSAGSVKKWSKFGLVGIPAGGAGSGRQEHIGDVRECPDGLCRSRPPLGARQGLRGEYRK